MLIRKPDRKAEQERLLRLLPHRLPGQLPPLRRVTRARSLKQSVYARAVDTGKAAGQARTDGILFGGEELYH